MKPKDFFPRPDVKMAWRRWESLPTLMSWCPFKLGNGFKLDELTCTCAKCQNSARHENAKGELIDNGEGGYELRSIVWCQGCNLLTYCLGDIVPYRKKVRITTRGTPPYWSPWGEDNASIRGGFGSIKG